MKKIVSFLLAALLMGTTAGCTSSSTASSSSTAAQSTASTTAESGSDSAQGSTTDWPKRAIQLIVPLAAGGDTDFYGRTYAKYLQQELNQPVTIVNVTGAGGTVGAEQVKNSKPDGYTVLFYHTGNLYTNNLLGTSDLTEKDFEIAAVGVLDDTNVLVAGKQTGIKDGKDFLEKVKTNKYNIATTMAGFSYYTVCKLEKSGGFKANAVDVGSASGMIPSVLGKQTQLAMNSYGVFQQYIKSGDVIPLMTMGTKRNPNFPDIPTAEELGIKDSNAERAYFFAFPKNTPKEIVKKMSDAVGAIQKNDEYVTAIKKQYCVEPFYKSCDEAPDYMQTIWKEMEPFKDALKG
jgi:tripartite-type tricarboxylate transporter receptor subunit TctC